MDILFSRVFWGAMIILVGMIIIVNTIFKLNIPIIRIIFAFVIILIGIRVLVGTFKTQDSNTTFSSNHITVTQSNLQKEYNSIFGSQTVDLKDLIITQDTDLEMNSIFGSQSIILPDNMNIRIKGSAVFGSLRFPDGNQVGFGDQTYRQSSDSLSNHTLFIEGNAVFGSIQFNSL